MAEIEAAWVEHIEIARMRVLGETDSRAMVKCAHQRPDNETSCYA
jgi:hypothetical protein